MSGSHLGEKGRLEGYPPFPASRAERKGCKTPGKLPSARPFAQNLIFRFQQPRFWTASLQIDFRAEDSEALPVVAENERVTRLFSGEYATIHPECAGREWHFYDPP